jgi:hypothetical protein
MQKLDAEGVRRLGSIIPLQYSWLRRTEIVDRRDPNLMRCYGTRCQTFPTLITMIKTRSDFHSGLAAEAVLSSALGTRSSPLDSTRWSSWIADFKRGARFEMLSFASLFPGPASPRFPCTAAVSLIASRFHIHVPMVVGRRRECSVPTALG